MNAPKKSLDESLGIWKLHAIKIGNHGILGITWETIGILYEKIGGIMGILGKPLGYHGIQMDLMGFV